MPGREQRQVFYLFYPKTVVGDDNTDSFSLSGECQMRLKP